ncbi:hypothetical protein KDX38_04240 [Pseudomonas sp. CDFA 602]|uniref:hypothetical protein n=1 Tax=Pseudomonas californiensis TaxID=2829823 RepID=UPI001E6559FD|nr:hypothetical protein [Pseudomonas californiensis]MCD5993047.1 hypothetical protein [Pseudomonas californiensis]MCD5998424.1 hypothetical protein [Pseudomonas californiensis]
MRPTQSPAKRFTRHPSCEGSFEARVNQKPFVMTSLLGGLAERPELSQVSDHWVWKVIADGKVGNARTSFGLFFDHDLRLGTHNLIGHDRIRVIFNETRAKQSVIYHSGHFQTGVLTLIEANPRTLRLRGEFSFGMSAMAFDVTDGVFDVQGR